MWSISRINTQTKHFINIGLHLGGDATHNCIKRWGTYDLDIISKRDKRSFYNVKKIWLSIQKLLSFLKHTGGSTIFFGSFTEDYYEILKDASGRCRATFYGDSEEWVYGHYTNFLVNLRCDIAFLPDLINNHALLREFYPSFTVIIGIRTTDSIPNLDFPLIGDPNNMYHILYYSHLIAYAIAKSTVNLDFTDDIYYVDYFYNDWDNK
jgi:hypothetical protein